MKKIALILSFVLLTTATFGQKKKKTTQKVEKTETVIMVSEAERLNLPVIAVPTESEVVYDEMPVVISERKVEVVYQENGNYNYREIGAGYSIVEYSQYSDNNKIGIAKDKKLIVPMIFNRYYDFTGAECIVLNIDNQYGMFNALTEKWTLPLQYKSISKLGNSHFSVVKDDKHGIVDKFGQLIEDFNWSYISSMSIPEYVTVSSGDNRGLYSLIHKKLMIPCEYDYLSFCQYIGNVFIVKKNDKYNLIDLNNKVLLNTWYDELSMPNHEIGNFIVRIGDKMGIIKYNDEIVIPIEYKKIEKSTFSDGSIIAQNKEGKFGCISIHGRVTLPFEYDSIETKYNDSYKNIFTKKDKCGLLQMNQGVPFEIATCEYDYIEPYKTFFIAKNKNKYVMLNNNNQPINDYEFDTLELFNKSTYSSYNNNGIFIGTFKKKTYLINSMGVILNTKPYTSIEKIVESNVNRSFSNQSASIYKAINEKGGIDFLDIYGILIVSDVPIDDATVGYANNIVIKKDNKYGVYSLNSKKMVIAPEYEEMTPVKEGYLVLQNKKYYIISYNNATKTLL